MKAPYLLPALVIGLLAYSSLVVGEETTDESKEKEAVVLDGVFESKDSQAIKAGTKQFKSLVIRDIVPSGTRVKQGDKIVSFESDELDEQLRDAEAALELARVSLDEAEFDFEQFVAAQRLDRQDAERAWQLAKQAFDNYANVDRGRNIKSAEFSLKSSRASYENALEELQQLEKMYKEDELTEESEEIVLKRAKQAVESAQFRLENAEIQNKRTIQQRVPAETAEHEAKLARAEMTYDKAKTTLKFVRQKRELEFKETERKFRKQKEDFEQLREDRRKLVAQASNDGIVYHGKVTRGRLTDKPSSLAPGSKVTSEQVLATLTRPDELQIRVDLDEKILRQIQVGAVGIATPTAFPELKIDTKVKSVSSVPFSKGKFDCVLSADISTDSAIVPGMSCTIKFPSVDHVDEDEKREDDEDADDEDEEHEDEEGEDEEGEDKDDEDETDV